MSFFDRLARAADVKRVMVRREDALPGRAAAVPLAVRHLVLGTPMRGSAGADGSCPGAGIGEWDAISGEPLAAVVFAGGCFWGVEEIFWQVPGVYSTAVGYAGGYTSNPTYEEVCTARTGHAEAVLVVYRPDEVSLEQLLELFFTAHDPTQEMRQGNDIGTQYRSAVFTFDEAACEAAVAAAQRYQPALTAAGYGPISTEISQLADAGDGRFYYAEDYHQQYLAKNPNGYRCHALTGVAFPAG